MKIAVIGGGVSGLSSAYYLAKKHDVTVFEANNYMGGHTDTHRIRVAGLDYNVDSGFIVFNEHNYPNFTALLTELEVASQPTEMSFSVSNSRSSLEYNATNLNRLFCQRRNLLSPRFYRMLLDISRFYREAPQVLSVADDGQTLGDYLAQHRYSQIFIEDHLLPMACALWSGPRDTIAAFPVRYFVSFMRNHNMLNVADRPQWRTVKNGSKSYVDKLIANTDANMQAGAKVQRVSRDASGVTVRVNGESHRFDKVVFATHSDQALRILEKPSAIEIEILGQISYQTNDIVLHSDTSILPKKRAAWASWNARVCPELATQCTVSYHMNTLQNLSAPLEFIVSLNSGQQIDPAKVFLSRRYEHPVYTQQTLVAQQRWSEIAGEQHSYFCGAYWGWGFHEDGVNSALRVLDALTRDSERLSDVA